MLQLEADLAKREHEVSGLRSELSRVEENSENSISSEGKQEGLRSAYEARILAAVAQVCTFSELVPFWKLAEHPEYSGRLSQRFIRCQDVTYDRNQDPPCSKDWATHCARWMFGPVLRIQGAFLHTFTHSQLLAAACQTHG